MAIPKSKPRQTGPKSDAGKKKSSTNALQHGASATLNLSQSTFELVRSYEQELLSHYSPDNPLLKLQIQRIATTRAKLTQLYQLEQAKLSMVYKEFDANPKQVMESIQDADELVASITLTYLEEGEFKLPFDLQPIQIKQVAKEVSSIKAPVLTHEEIEKHLPKLFRLLTTLKPGWLSGIESDGDALDLLKVVGENFRLMFKKNSPISDELIAHLEMHLEAFKHKEELNQAKLNESGNFVDASKGVAVDEKSIISDEIKKYLNYFVHFDHALDQVKGLIQRFKVQSEMMRATLALPPDESDRLSRHQTTLERRLSTQIGELRVMLAK